VTVNLNTINSQWILDPTSNTMQKIGYAILKISTTEFSSFETTLDIRIKP
jgi:hypothetical protein